MRYTTGFFGSLGLFVLLSSFACGGPNPSDAPISFLPPGQRANPHKESTKNDAHSPTDHKPTDHKPMDHRPTPDHFDAGPVEPKMSPERRQPPEPSVSEATKPESRSVPDKQSSPDRAPSPERRPPPPRPTKWIGEPCISDRDCMTTNARCLRQQDGYPGGHCTTPCSTRCPDQSGKAVTFCVASSRIAGHTGMCVSRCDTNLYPKGGCRQGYYCKEAGRNTEPQTRRQICVPGQAPPPRGCYAQLAQMGVRFVKASDPNQRPKGGGSKRCSVKEALKLKPPVLGVDWVYSPTGKRYDMFMGCQLALRIAKLSRYLKSRGITKAQHIGTYQCRRIRTDSGYSRNLSNHSYGTAIDIGGFFNSKGKLYSLVKHWDHSTTWLNSKKRMGCWSTRFKSPEAKLLYEIACQMWKQRMFSLILTPNYNRAHDDHFHVDLSSSGRVISTQPLPPYIGKHDALGH